MSDTVPWDEFATKPFQHVALMVHDALACHDKPFTEEQLAVLRRALRKIVLDEVSEEDPGLIFKEILDARIQTTMPYNREMWKQFVKSAIKRVSEEER